MIHASTSRFTSRLDYLPKTKVPLNLTKKWKSKLREFNQYIIEHKKLRRKKAQARSILFNAIGLCISLSLVLVAFEWKFYDSQELVNLGALSAEFEEILEIPVTEQPPPPPPKAQAVNILEVPDVEEIEDELEIVLDVEVTEETTYEDVVYDAEVTIEEETADEVFIFVEESPHPVGGYETFYKDVASRLTYPPMARRMRTEGKVYISFIINKDGSLTDLEVLKGIGTGCDQEALRVLSESPKWSPGKQRGKPVKVKMTLPILFVLE